MTLLNLYEISDYLEPHRFRIFGENLEEQQQKILPCLDYLEELIDNDCEAFCTIINKITTDHKLKTLLPWICDTMIKEAAFKKWMQCYQVLIPFASPEALHYAIGYDPDIWPVILEITRHDPTQYVQGLKPTSEGPINPARIKYIGLYTAAQDERNNYCWVMGQPMSIRTSMVWRNLNNWQYKSHFQDINQAWTELQAPPAYSATETTSLPARDEKGGGATKD
jgi:hypothetical protein